MDFLEPIMGKKILMNAALYVASKLPEADRREHKLFKILWFADLSHLKKYGRTITGDTYYSFPYGPVPTALYDEIKVPDHEYKCFERFDMGTEKGFLRVFREPDMDYLSETDVQELDSSIAKYKDMPFKKLTETSHKSAWKKARGEGYINSIRMDEILDEIGASDELRKYVNENKQILREA